MSEPSKPGRATAPCGVWKDDFLSSAVVFLVALPLCAGIAIASGVPAEKAAAVGIITGIVGGLVVGLLGGCPLQVSGPAAGLAVIVGELIAEHGFARLGLIVMVAGAVQLAAGLLRTHGVKESLGCAVEAHRGDGVRQFGRQRFGRCA